jgi:hypothetical protein
LSISLALTRGGALCTADAKENREMQAPQGKIVLPLVLPPNALADDGRFNHRPLQFRVSPVFHEAK